ncbi:MAG: hypothetical protein AAB968_01110 [Patescibacteria group bacterium]
MTFGELVQESFDEYYDFKQVHDGKKMHSEDNRQVAAEATAMSYLAGGYETLCALGVATFAAVLVTLKDKFSAEKGTLILFNQAQTDDAPVELSEMETEEYEFGLTWEELTKHLVLDEIFAPIVGQALAEDDENFLVLSIFVALKMRDEMETKTETEEEDV